MKGTTPVPTPDTEFEIECDIIISAIGQMGDLGGELKVLDNGKGFINNIVDLDAYATQHGLDGFVIEGRAYMMKSSNLYQEYQRSPTEPSGSALLQRPVVLL